jgi:hypothetical protein
MRVLMETVSAGEMPYPTAGEVLWEAPDFLHIKVLEGIESNHPEGLYHALLVGLHEFVEMILCRRQQVSYEEICKWDIDHLDADEPGQLPDAPYHRQHMAAENLEQLLAWMLKLNLNEYDEAVQRAVLDVPDPNWTKYQEAVQRTHPQLSPRAGS